VDTKSLEEIYFTFQVDSLEIFLFDRSLLSKLATKRKNTRKQKVQNILKEDFLCLGLLVTQYDTSQLVIRVFNESMSTEKLNNFDTSSYEVHLPLSKSNSFPG